MWPRKDYPWISLWCSSEGGAPRARGLEFGTTGLHQPFPILVKHPRIFELPTFTHLDGQPSTVSRSFCSFLAAVPKGFKGVERLLVKSDSIEVDGLVLPTGPLFV